MGEILNSKRKMFTLRGVHVEWPKVLRTASASLTILCAPLSFFPGLKKVTDDMKTHKNPELRQSSVVKSSDLKPKATSSGPKFGAAATGKKPPKMELQGNKWIVVSV